MTAGEKALKASKDTTIYHSMELADDLVKDVAKEVEQCIKNHLEVFKGIPKFCVVGLIAGDCIIPNAMRIKYFALPWLPKPRPDQSCFLFDSTTHKVKHLWTLPSAQTMAEVSTLLSVHDSWKKIRIWSVAFYNKDFWPIIRKMNAINLLAEEEMIDKQPESYEKLVKLIAERIGESNE